MRGCEEKKAVVSHRIVSSRTQTMQRICGVFVCAKDKKVRYGQPQPGACPYCGGTVQAMNIKTQWKFFFLPLFFWKKRKSSCSTCESRCGKVVAAAKACWTFLLVVARSVTLGDALFKNVCSHFRWLILQTTPSFPFLQLEHVLSLLLVLLSSGNHLWNILCNVDIQNCQEKQNAKALSSDTGTSKCQSMQQ
ncbi:hypothetical protein QQP08_025240 [Theobroma cacao]|nr:hypothetical protein QQP08_025240 [Theobroma cacao]